MLRSALGAFLPPLRPAHAASDSDSAFCSLRLKDFREEAEEEPKDTLENRKPRTMVPNRTSSRRVEQSNCSSSVVESSSASAAVAISSSFSPSSSSFPAPRSMWQEAMRRKRYLLNRTGESGEGDKRGSGGGQEKRNRSPEDWLYESYYCMSQQHPLIVFLLLIVMGACVALLTVFFASGLVSCSFTASTHRQALTRHPLTHKLRRIQECFCNTYIAYTHTCTVLVPRRSTNVKRRVR